MDTNHFTLTVKGHDYFVGVIHRIVQKANCLYKIDIEPKGQNGVFHGHVDFAGYAGRDQIIKCNKHPGHSIRVDEQGVHCYTCDKHHILKNTSVKQKPKFENMYFELNGNSELSERLQNTLFDLGYSWRNYHTRCLFLNANFLFTDERGVITHATDIVDNITDLKYNKTSAEEFINLHTRDKKHFYFENDETKYYLVSYAILGEVPTPKIYFARFGSFCYHDGRHTWHSHDMYYHVTNKKRPRIKCGVCNTPAKITKTEISCNKCCTKMVENNHAEENRNIGKVAELAAGYKEGTAYLQNYKVRTIPIEITFSGIRVYAIKDIAAGTMWRQKLGGLQNYADKLISGEKFLKYIESDANKKDVHVNELYMMAYGRKKITTSNGATYELVDDC